MSNEKIRDLLTQLRKELDAADIDPATRSLMRELDGDIKGVLDSADGPLVKRRWPHLYTEGWHIRSHGRVC